MFRRAILQSTRLFATGTAYSGVRQSPATYVARCYSTEPGKEEGDKAAEVKVNWSGNGNGGQVKAGEAGPAKELLEEVSKVKAELDAKSKEAAELKVCGLLSLHSS